MCLSLRVFRKGHRCWRNWINWKSSILEVSMTRSRSCGNVTKIKTRMSHILKSPYDKKNYREITLSNGMTALLISDMDQVSLRPLPVHQHRRDHAISSSDTEATTDEDMDEERMSVTSEEDDSCADVPQVSGLLSAQARECPKRNEKKAAAALCVGVGSFSDPEDIPGFAHFLEHMVFMGSKKYKRENAFDDFISKHGGESNAWTDAERTVFFFDIHKEYFHKALDMFSHFFISPLFLKSSVDREIMAVDNEFQMIKHKDSDRYHKLIGTLAFPGNPMQRFLCGNQKTLKTIPEEKGLDVHGRLRDFYRRMYSAHYMTLVVQAPESLDNLQELVYDLFEEVPNNEMMPPSMAEHRDPFVPRNFHKLLKVVPVENCHRLDICWALPPLYKRFKCKPLDYLGVLITHEGPGSIMSCLRKRGLAMSLSGGNDGTGFDQNKLWSAFGVSIILTDTGLEQVSEVISIVFEYIGMLQKCGPQAWFYKELRDIENIKFRFRDECDPIENVEEIAEDMQLYPLEHYLTGRSLILSYDAQLLRECLSYLTPTQSCLTLWSKTYETQGVCNLVEPWFGVLYSITDVPEEWKRQWQELKPRPELILPEENAFIPCKFDLLDIEGTAEHPVQVLDSEFGRMWYKKDKKFKMPKGFILFHLMTPVISSSVKSVTLCDLYIGVLEQQLSETLYAASLAGYEFSLAGTQTGFIFHVEGFSHKLPQVLELFVTRMADFSVTEELFTTVKSQLKKTYYNEMIKTYEFAEMLRQAVTYTMNPPLPDRYHVTDSLTIAMLCDFHRDVMDALYIEGLMTGNFSPQHAIEVGGFVQKKLCRQPLPADRIPVKRILKLPSGDLQCRARGVNRKDTNSCVTSFYQHGPGTIRESCLNELMVARMREPVFNQLRTKLQLGYNVFCQTVHNSGILGFAITVETHANKFGMSEVESHIADLMEDFKKTMNKMTKSQFAELVNSVITAKQVEDTHLGNETNRYWQEVLDRYYIFDRQEREIATLKTITQAELKSWYQKYLDASHRHISFQVEGCKHVDMDMDRSSETDSFLGPSSVNGGSEEFFKLITDGDDFIEDIVKFHKSLKPYPVTKLIS